MSDGEFPWLEAEDYFPFPPPEEWRDEVVGVGGNLSPGLLLSAYAQGIFPWFNEGEEILWWSLDPRFLLYPEDLHISKSMRRTIRSGRYTLSLDRDFPGVIHSCGAVSRRDEEGTWISRDMEEAYIRLHELGFAHSVEVYAGEELAGGLYGISLGRCFCGESMFARRPDASKTALIALTLWLKEQGFAFVDCQQPTAHLGSLGAAEVSRQAFLEELNRALQAPTLRGAWGELYPDFPFSRGWADLAGGKRG